MLTSVILEARVFVVVVVINPFHWLNIVAISSHKRESSEPNNIDYCKVSIIQLMIM